MSQFLQVYLKRILSSTDNDFVDNYDSDRFGPEVLEKKSIKQRISRLLEKAGIVTTGARALAVNQAKRTICSGLEFVEPHLADLDWLYSNLADEESRQALVDVLAFRALGYRKIKLPTNCQAHWDNLKIAEKLADGCEQIDSGFNRWKLTKMNLLTLGYPIEIYFSPAGVVIDFMEQQYRCDTPEGTIECTEGDYVIDAGGCWGDTALYFAHKAGNNGKVYSFEFLPDNLKIYDKNLSLNPLLSPRIKRIENPLWSCGGEEVAISAYGPGSSIVPEASASTPNLLRFQSAAIDDLVENGGIEKVNFIKMDIEGAELQALKGSEQTIRRFKPKLTITVYHDLKDFWEIPEWINNLDLGYKFYLRHFTIHAEETVLYAKASYS